MFASNDSVTYSFQTKSYFKDHTYFLESKNKRVTIKWLVANYLHKYKCISSMSLVNLKDLVKEYIHVELILTHLRTAKLLTMAKYTGDLKVECATPKNMTFFFIKHLV